MRDKDDNEKEVEVSTLKKKVVNSQELRKIRSAQMLRKNLHRRKEQGRARLKDQDI
ncbi:hypothetical protein [Candidatus Liberibacter sp.]|uniref:hypothetical protein n=1 Tax=Candidatus Liberibacter sp. TaxID=34022 RepID=UPI0015F6727C|nr:hypothetical protein [Candidatus Liberibacter sp.]MBA5723742.1 hypothetical protein [Candidatus Liberibacter sp.]